MPRRNALKKGRRSGGLLRSLKWPLFLVLFVIVFPILEVGCVRFINPPRTPEMLRFEWFGKNEAARKRGLRYEWMPLEEIPRDQIRYIWASEDQRFFEHDGIDFDEIELALKEAEKTGKKPRGASTITMQCARSLFLWQGRSWIRKALETYYTVLMELLLSKQRILELYLNVIELGDGIYGVKAGAETWFGRPPSRLTKSQMALLAAILPNPKEWNPSQPSSRVLQRQQRVLRLANAADFPDHELPRARRK